MKDDLLRLIDRVDSLEDLIGDSEIIYSIPEFANWKQQLQFELESICADKNNRAIESTLDIIKNKFMGYTDKQAFSNLKGALSAIKNNIDQYYPLSVSNPNKNKSPKVFISHSSEDKEYVECIVDLLECIGLRDKSQLFCSSIPEYGVPLGENIYDYLKQQFESHHLHVIFVLSKNYYKSVP